MAEQIREFGNLPIISVAPMALQNAITGGGSSADQPEVASYPDPESDGYDDYPQDDPSIAIGAPHTDYDPSCITVYPESITPSGSYNEKSPVCSFDIVFSVGIREGDTSKTYRVVKRIGIDKCKLASEAESSTPISVVEDKTKEKQAQAAATAKRFRILAGLE